MNIDITSKVYLNNTEIVRISDDNGQVIWEKGSVEPEYFYVQNEYNGQNTFTLTKQGSPDIQNIEWSKDKETWTAFDLSQSQNSVTLESGEKLYMRNDSGYFSQNASYYYKINCSENYSVGGNINTLLNYNDLSNVILYEYCFDRLFYQSTTLISAQYLLLPSSTLARYCYEYMFYGCTSLVNAPALPATTLHYGCYRSMFYGCTSLTTAPELNATNISGFCYERMFYGCTSLVNVQQTLPATTLDFEYDIVSSLGCYGGMFQGCTSLVNAPSLPATTLTTGCYQYMFRNCTSLVNAPELPARTLKQSCYYEMFRGCSSLKNIIIYANSISATTCLTNWVNGVSSTGDFYKLGSASFSTGVNGIPSGWTVHTSL